MKAHRFALAGALALPIFAGLIAFAPLGILQKQSNDIIVGKTVSVSSTEAGSSVSVEVQRVVKGKMSAGSTVTLRVDSPIPDSKAADSLGPRLWFVRAGNVVASRIVNVDGIEALSLPAATAAEYAIGESASGPQKLTREVMAILRLKGLDDGTRTQLNGYIRELPSAERQDVLRLVQTNQAVAATPENASALLGMSSVQGVTQLMELVKAEKVTLDVADSLCHYRNPDDSGIRLIGSLLQTSLNQGLKMCAMISLKAIHTPETVAWMASGLTSASKEEQYLAVTGLYLAANSGAALREETLMADGLPIKRVPRENTKVIGVLPPFDAFVADGGTTLDFWRNWAAQQPSETH
ncbi:MAG: hypothetical protein ABI693_21205 [Bryobacteraceae bacterium]